MKDFHNFIAIAFAKPSDHRQLLIVLLHMHISTDAMNAMEFRQYILKDLTIDEREFVMKYEVLRRKTFMAGWPHQNSDSLCGDKMARAGFYFIGKCCGCSCFGKCCLNNSRYQSQKVQSMHPFPIV